VKRAAMAQIVTIKELEEKYGWGWVILKNPQSDDWATPQRGEYIFHSQNRTECHAKVDELPDVPLAFMFFGKHPEQKNKYPSLSFLTIANEDPTDYK
ncbi:MAG: hypothetical protein KA149_04260, partial [Chitinophagales bacterium]|nr:hypothetical protein [Chitinophagales bacterium]